MTGVPGLRIVLLLIAVLLVGAGESSVEVVYEAEPVKSSEKSSYYEPIDRIFKNPALASGIASGAEAINRSVETLMDALFYSILDNELRWDLTDHAWFNVNLQRDVFTTNSGADVVVDRVALGPEYLRRVSNLQSLPVNIGVKGTVDVLQIYLRTDGMRIAENQEVGPIRYTLNNWFGLLPLLARTLPPSFNPNEMYDPVRQLETPFVFPLSVETFYEMDVGSIRSYSVGGVVKSSVLLDGALDQKTRGILKDLEGFNASLPYTVFKEGEYRINVLRRSETVAWVGLAEVNRVGHAVSPNLGSNVFIMQGALSASLAPRGGFGGFSWVWQGVPGFLFPINAEFEQAFANVFDQVFEFDLSKTASHEAYLAAVRGDFTVAKSADQRRKDRGINSGVRFHFNRKQDRVESNVSQGANLTVLSLSRDRFRQKSEVEIRDNQGRFYVLEARQSIEDESWDVLVGRENAKMQSSLEMKVRKVFANHSTDDILMRTWSELAELTDVNSEWEGDGKYTYVFSTDKSPINMVLAFDIQDKYTTAEEYDFYKKELEYFTYLSLEELPKIDRWDDEFKLERRRRHYLANPFDEVRYIHITPTYLGEFGAQVVVQINYSELMRILKRSEKQKWAAFAEAFGKDVDVWSSAKMRGRFAFEAQWWPAFLMYPLRLLNIRLKSVDAIFEVTDRIAALDLLKKALTPLEKLDAAYKLFDTAYPKELARALLSMAKLDRVPRKITFYSKPKGAADAGTKRLFKMVNGKSIAGGLKLDAPTRYAMAKETLGAFYLNKPREAKNRPEIAKLVLAAKRVPKGYAKGDQLVDPSSIDENKKFISVKLNMRKTLPGRASKVYLKVEQAGKIKIGKLALGEEVVAVYPKESLGDKIDELQYEFFISGPLSPFDDFIFNQALGIGGDFTLTIAVSREGGVWSDEKVVNFGYYDGRLRPVR